MQQLRILCRKGEMLEDLREGVLFQRSLQIENAVIRFRRFHRCLSVRNAEIMLLSQILCRKGEMLENLREGRLFLMSL